ncbi:hypothetical protein PS623_02923 [Pseudomonas fluorescens]|nr:hypothetical protein PS623_02923 [Pseudomonas fluorescens]
MCCWSDAEPTSAGAAMLRHGHPTSIEQLASQALLGYSRLTHPQRLQLRSPADEQCDVLIPAPARLLEASLA